MVTTYERGKIDGIVEGKLEAMREMLLLQLNAKFHPLPATITERVMAMPPESLPQLMVAVVHGQSLDELHLAD